MIRVRVEPCYNCIFSPLVSGSRTPDELNYIASCAASGDTFMCYSDTVCAPWFQRYGIRDWRLRMAVQLDLVVEGV